MGLFTKNHTNEGPDDLFYPPVTTPPRINNNTELFEHPDNSSMKNETTPNIDTNVDVIIGSIAIFLTLLGLTGNTVACLYFRQERKSMHHMFYTVISLCDALTSAATFPVIVSLLSSRYPVLFDLSWICISWPVFYYLVFRVSMILVVLLSVTRTISIVSPLKQIKHHAKKFIYGVIGYAIFLLTIDVIFICLKWVKDRYYRFLSLCELVPIQGHSKSEDTQTRMYSILLQLELIIPCLVVLASCLITTTTLLKRRQVQYSHINSKNDERFRSVSVTIALYTAVFLACFLPCCVLQGFYFASMFQLVPGILRNKVFLSYGHLVAQFLLPLLNSGVNPFLYFSRMSQYRKWLGDVMKKPSRLIVRSRYGNVGSSRSKMGSSRMGSSFHKLGSKRSLGSRTLSTAVSSL